MQCLAERGRSSLPTEVDAEWFTLRAREGGLARPYESLPLMRKLRLPRPEVARLDGLVEESTETVAGVVKRGPPEVEL